MDIQFYGANCLVITTKRARLTIDDNLKDLGGSSITKPDDIVIFTHKHDAQGHPTKLLIDGPGEYEINEVLIQGINTRAHDDETDKKTATLYKLLIDELRVVITGHIYPELSEEQLEVLGIVDVLCIPVGGNGYTLDGVDALRLIKKIAPKLVIPTHYATAGLKYPVPQQTLTEALKSLGMEPKETTGKLRLKLGDLTDITQLIVLERS